MLLKQSESFLSIDTDRPNKILIQVQFNVFLIKYQIFKQRELVFSLDNKVAHDDKTLIFGGKYFEEIKHFPFNVWGIFVGLDVGNAAIKRFKLIELFLVLDILKELSTFLFENFLELFPPDLGSELLTFAFNGAWEALLIWIPSHFL